MTRRSPLGVTAGCLAVVVLLTANGPAVTGESGSSPPADEVVRRLQARYEETSDFRGRFVQTVEVSGLDEPMQSEGRVWFRRPGRMRWEFSVPEPQTIVGDGEFLWVHQPDQNQVLRAPFDSAFRSSVPVSFLLGVGQLEKDFRATVVEAGEEEIRLRLEPRDDPEIGTLVFVLDPETYDIEGAAIGDALGNVTRLEFRDLERNVGVEGSRFEFEVPEGADLVTPPSFRDR